MSEADNLLKKGIRGYREARMAIVRKWMDHGVSRAPEELFHDEGRGEVRLKRLQQEFADNGRELEQALRYEDRNSRYTKEKLERLAERQQSICLEMAVEGSNRFDLLENCLQLLTGLDTDFKEAILALIAYREGRKEEAFAGLYRYLSPKTEFIRHYLIEKCYGILLKERGQNEAAVRILCQAAELRPEDPEIHHILHKLYVAEGRTVEAAVEEQIVRMLEGSSWTT